MKRGAATALGILGLTLAAPAAAAGPTEDDEFNAFLIQIEQGENAFTKGNPAPLMALLADSADVTLLGGAGGHVKGADAIRERTAGISARYSEGDTEVEYLAARVVGDMAYTVSIDRRELRLDDGQTTNSDLRTTQIYIRQNGQWRLMHRHSDPQVEFQQAPPPPPQ